LCAISKINKEDEIVSNVEGYYGVYKEFSGWTVDRIAEAIDKCKDEKDREYCLRLLEELDSRV
jgi:hypothetical protein